MLSVPCLGLVMDSESIGDMTAVARVLLCQQNLSVFRPESVNNW